MIALIVQRTNQTELKNPFSIKVILFIIPARIAKSRLSISSDVINAKPVSNLVIKTRVLLAEFII